MYKLRAGGVKLLKIAHLITASCWVGGSIALGLPYLLKQTLTNPQEIHGINLLMHHIDVWLVIIPGAMGCLLTGLIYSICTEWGFFKYRWLTVKWVITISAILFGTFYLGPWIQVMIAQSETSAGISSDIYMDTQRLHFIWGTVQAVMLLLTVAVSVYKPWKKR